jgi:hypothetical protein
MTSIHNSVTFKKADTHFLTMLGDEMRSSDPCLYNELANWLIIRALHDIADELKKLNNNLAKENSNE